jgi:hypothetical protein
MIILFILGWLLCGYLAIRIENKLNFTVDNYWELIFFLLFGSVSLLIEIIICVVEYSWEIKIENKILKKIFGIK